MKITKHIVSKDDGIYEAWPDLTITNSGKLICIFAECLGHTNRDYTRIMLCESGDQGKNWSAKRPLTESSENKNYYYNVPRISKLADGRLIVLIDKIIGRTEENEAKIVMYTSDDEGRNWSSPIYTPASGIVPDKLLELDSGRWLISCHSRDTQTGCLIQKLWYSDNKGASWEGPVTVGSKEGLNLCEASILPVRGALVAFMRENSWKGFDCYKSISRDEGQTWSEPAAFPLPGCHRPVAGKLRDGMIMLSYRFFQGGKVEMGASHNFFIAITDSDSALAVERNEMRTRIIPIDYDQSPASDTGYSGWVQFDDGRIFIVNYIVDDASKAYIRSYSVLLDSEKYFRKGIRNIHPVK